MMSPSRLRLRHWIILFGIATFIALLFCAQSYSAYNQARETFDWKLQLFSALLNWYLWGPFLPLILFLSQRFSFDPGTRVKSLAVHVPAAFVVAVLHSAAQIWLTTLFYPERGSFTQSFSDGRFLSAFFWRFMMYHIILIVCLALDYYRRARELQIQSSLIEANILKSQAESLTMQMDPDFLFASLKRLSHLMHKDIDAADTLVARMGDYLRLTLDSSKQQTVTLREEIEFVQSYLEIENIRTPGHCDIEYDIDAELYECKVPGLILRAPVEDLFRNQIDQKCVRLKIAAAKHDGNIVLSIYDRSSKSTPPLSPRLHQLLGTLNALYKPPVETQTNDDSIRIVVPLELQKRGMEEIAPLESSPEDEENETAVANVSLAKRWIITIGIFTFLATYFTVLNLWILTGRGLKMDWPGQLLINTGWYVWALLTPIVMKLSAKYPIQRGHILKRLPIHLISVPILWFTATLTFGAIRWCSNLGQYSYVEMVELTKAPFALDLLCYFSIVAVEHASRYYRNYKSGKYLTARLAAQLGRAKLHALRMQLHPHFLFNALNSLSELMQEDPTAAEEMILNLETFLHLTVDGMQEQEIPFEEELEFLKCYLAIEHIRFQDRLHITMEIEPQAMRVPVPNLLLQPIVENAIKHGIAPRSRPGEIEIQAKRNNGILKVSVRDNGPGMSKSQKRRIPVHPGLGLSNTRERLLQLYGDGHRFELSNAPEGGLIVSMEIPVHAPK